MNERHPDNRYASRAAKTIPVGFPRKDWVSYYRLDDDSRYRRVISSGDPEGIQELIDEVGDTLANQMKLSATVFVGLINEVFKESGPAEQLRIMELVRSFMNRMKDQ